MPSAKIRQVLPQNKEQDRSQHRSLQAADPANHNIEDDNVLFQNSMQMAKALEEADRPYFMQLYPQKTHGVTGKPRKALYEAMTSFFDANLK